MVDLYELVHKIVSYLQDHDIDIARYGSDLKFLEAVQNTHESELETLQEFSAIIDTRIRELKEEIANKEVDHVTTPLGNTFNDEGLHINKPGYDLTTDITSESLNVNSSTTGEVFKADIDGVTAPKLNGINDLQIGNFLFHNETEGEMAGRIGVYSLV